MVLLHLKRDTVSFVLPATVHGALSYSCSSTWRGVLRISQLCPAGITDRSSYVSRCKSHVFRLIAGYLLPTYLRILALISPFFFFLAGLRLASCMLVRRPKRISRCKGCLEPMYSSRVSQCTHELYLRQG